MLAFAKFGSYDYRGVPSKLLYKIVRYILALLLAVTLGIQIYIQVSMPDVVPYTPYATIVDIALISYLIMYKPSDSTPLKKVLKIVGYIIILAGVNALRNAKIDVSYLTYTQTEINWGIILASVVVVIIGITLLVYGGVNDSKAVKEKNIDNIQITDVNL
jgi:FtsH-binding integral membrane protein